MKSKAYSQRTRTLGSVTQIIVETLGSDIVLGKYSAPGSFPIEADICTQFNASRSVVREAIKVLNAKGLLNARPRKGTSVRSENDWNLLDPDVLNWMLQRPLNYPLLVDFTRARMAIEPAAAAEAARSANDEQRQNIQLMLKRMEQVGYASDEGQQADVDFHLAILEASNNQFFYHLSPMVETALRFSVKFTSLVEQPQEAQIEAHADIVNAIMKRDEAAASAAAIVLIEWALDIMLAVDENQLAG